jgi:hypothetical protein
LVLKGIEDSLDLLIGEVKQWRKAEVGIDYCHLLSIGIEV